jgi:23S rRNA pseudouridine1911/1915/1917 synthase
MSAPRAAREQNELPDDAIVHVDRSVVVVNKPAGISTVPYEEDERGALYDRVTATLRRRSSSRGTPLGVVHRLDKETSGLVVFARSLAAKRELKQQFRVHSTGRLYVAIVHGRIASQTIASRLVADRGDGIRGSTPNPELGQPAVTHVKALATAERATLVECRLETGRTHQIRIHLFEAGHPLAGERVYVRRFRAPPPTEPRIEAHRLMLHARTLEFDHPETGERLRFSSDLPEDLTRVALGLGLSIAEPRRR